MKYFVWLLRFAIFIALFGLAVKNSASVDLRFYFDHHFDVPLSLLVLAVFTMGVAVGVSAVLTTVIRQRRELKRRSSADRLNNKE